MRKTKTFFFKIFCIFPSSPNEPCKELKHICLLENLEISLTNVFGLTVNLIKSIFSLVSTLATSFAVFIETLCYSFNPPCNISIFFNLFA